MPQRQVPYISMKPASALGTASAESQFRANPSFGRTRLRLIADVSTLSHARRTDGSCKAGPPPVGAAGYPDVRIMGP
jgi:hypothetical protein